MCTHTWMVGGWWACCCLTVAALRKWKRELSLAQLSGPWQRFHSLQYCEGITSGKAAHHLSECVMAVIATLFKKRFQDLCVCVCFSKCPENWSANTPELQGASGRLIYPGCHWQDLTVALDIIVRADAKESGEGLMWHINGSPLAGSQGLALLSSAPSSSADRRHSAFVGRAKPCLHGDCERSLPVLSWGSRRCATRQTQQSKKKQCPLLIFYFSSLINRPFKQSPKSPTATFTYFFAKCQIPHIPPLSRQRPNWDINNPIAVILSCIWTAVV